jgi:hypothetical protein
MWASYFLILIIVPLFGSVYAFYLNMITCLS